MKILTSVAAAGLALGALIWFAASPTAPELRARFDGAFARGVQFLQGGRAGDARLAFMEAVRVRADVPEAHVNLGYASLALGLQDAAEKAFLTAIDLRPRQVNAYFGLAESLEQRGDLPGAIGAIRTYIHLAAADDPFRRRAMSAVWEWETAVAGSGVKTKPKPKPGGPLPDLVLTGLDGVAGSLAQYGGKTVILNFWATWCAPCREELPSLQRLSDRLDPAAFAVIGISVDDDADFVREFLRDSGVSYTNYLDVRGRVAAKRLAVKSYPQTLVIGPGGRLLRRIVGSRAWDEMDMDVLLTRRAKAGGEG